MGEWELDAQKKPFSQWRWHSFQGEEVSIDVPWLGLNGGKFEIEGHVGPHC